MITTHISGRRLKNEQVVDQYVENLIKALKITRFKKDLYITFDSTVYHNPEYLGVCGECDDDSGDIAVEIADKPDGSPKISFLNQMKTLAHEMVHVKQILRNELSITKDSFFWKSRKCDGYAYENQPWEREAERLEETLFLSCFPFDMPFKN